MKKVLIPLILLILILVGVWWIFSVAEKQSPITNFEECANAGNPVMESYPRQCRSAEGELFIEIISEPIFNETISG